MFLLIIKKYLQLLILTHNYELNLRFHRKQPLISVLLYSKLLSRQLPLVTITSFPPYLNFQHELFDILLWMYFPLTVLHTDKFLLSCVLVYSFIRLSLLTGALFNRLWFGMPLTTTLGARIVASSVAVAVADADDCHKAITPKCADL